MYTTPLYKINIIKKIKKRNRNGALSLYLVTRCYMSKQEQKFYDKKFAEGYENKNDHT